MEKDRDRLIIEMTAALQDLEKRGLTPEETSIILWTETVGPYVENVRDAYIRLAYFTGATYPV